MIVDIHSIDFAWKEELTTNEWHETRHFLRVSSIETNGEREKKWTYS